MDPIDMMTTDYNCEYLGLSRLCLMENAGKSLSDEVATLSTFKFSKPVKILIFTGSGGNGGDGFVAARHLLNRGFEVEVYCLNGLDEIKSADALANLEILMNMEPRISRLSVDFIKDSSDLDRLDFGSNTEYIVLDCLLGTGIKRKLRTKVRKTVELINELEGIKIAVDAPSGLDPLTGEINDIAVDADYTVSFHKIKTGVKLAGEEKTGGVITCDIGIPIEAELFVEGGDLLRLKNRSDDSHKGNNGKVLIVGGSKDYYGAPAISAKAAIATGVDLTYIYTPRNAAIPIKSFSEDFIVKEAKGDYLSLEDLEDILDMASKVDAVLLGPGSSQEEETAKLFNVLAMKIDKPLVLDADALKLVDLSIVSKRDDLIITPHLSEFKSFFKNIPKEDMDKLEKAVKMDDKDNLDFVKVNNKIDSLHKITRNINGSVILKGKYDFIFNGNRLKINRTGNPGMTVGGTGDALAGICLSLLSQGLNSFDAALLAPYLNGKAGDLAYEAQGYGFGAQDLTQYLGAVMSDLIE
ncbi:MAG: NAD(P)H-hydrate dehydratase [Methanobrevibacter olleyae]|uniref:Bifunctional NAD(P)H-hydrate repair enzyme n=1 Tax=Methanobrevibacter olleyae TaxID=294671 RepID=A0A8T3VQR8_METOL|nr:NAD(P)H-hydrate dehydratase [Methanobrevibacter olleyae]